MTEQATNMIWCEEYTAENWDDVSALKWEGRAVAQAGRLKAPSRCQLCETELPAGAYAEAISLHEDQLEAAVWMTDLFVSDERLEGVLVAVELDGAGQALS